jgi:hypothetical protein
VERIFKTLILRALSLSPKQIGFLQRVLMDNCIFRTSNFDVDWVTLYDLPLAPDHVDSLADVVTLVVVGRVLNDQTVLIATFQNLPKKEKKKAI